MDKEIKSIFDKLSEAIEKEIKSQLDTAITEIEEEHSYLGLDKKFYGKKLEMLFSEYKNNLMTYGKVVKYSKEGFIGSYNNERDILILKEEYKNERLRTEFISDRGRFYLKSEILAYLKLKAREETDGKTRQATSKETSVGSISDKEQEKDSKVIDERKEILNFKEACQFLSMKPPTLYKYTSQRLIPFIKKSKNIYFMRKELEEWLELGRKKTKSQISEEITALKKKH